MMRSVLAVKLWMGCSSLLQAAGSDNSITGGLDDHGLE